MEKIVFIRQMWEIAFIQKSVKLLLTIVFFYVLISIANFFIKKLLAKILNRAKNHEAKKQIQTVQTVTISTTDTVLFIIMAFHILSILGIDIRPFLAAAGVAGVAIGFGAKNFVEDIISGFSILLSGQLRVGDIVEIGSSIGTVQKINIRTVILRDVNGRVHYINNRIVDKIINYTQEFSYAVFNIDVAYKEDIAHVINVIKELGEEIRQDNNLSKYILDDLEMFGLESFESSSVRIKCRIKTRTSHYLGVFYKFNLMIKERFDKEGIEIPFNQITIHQADN